MGKLGLAQFETWAKEHKRKTGPRCSVCMLPSELLAVIHAARDKGHGGAVLCRFLHEHGQPDMTRHRLDNHFREGHRVKVEANSE